MGRRDRCKGATAAEPRANVQRWDALFSGGGWPGDMGGLTILGQPRLSEGAQPYLEAESHTLKGEPGTG